MSRQKGSAGVWKFIHRFKQRSKTARKSKYEPHQGAAEMKRTREYIESEPVRHQLAWQKEQEERQDR